MKLSQIKPNPKNPRLIKDDKFEQLVKSLKDFPQMMKLRPIIIDENNIIQGGNMRFKALKALGYKDIPDEWVKQAKDLTPEQWREFVIKDNLAYGEMNWDMILSDWDQELLQEWGLDFPEVTMDPQKAVDDNYEPPEGIKTDIILGDIIEIGEHRLICGDSAKPETYRNLMDGLLADLIITDPPYNVNYSSKNERLNLYDKGNRIQKDIENDNFIDRKQYNNWIKSVFGIIKKHVASYNSVYVFGNAESLISFYEMDEFHVSNMLVWVKNRLVLGRQDYKGKHENIIYGWWNHHRWHGNNSEVTVFEDEIDFTKLKKDELLKIITDIFSDKVKTTVLKHDTPLKNDLHPTMKPITLLGDLVNNSSKKGELILDPFLGSGSTMVAAHQLNRKCYGMELDPLYCQVIIDRMQKLDPGIEIKKHSLSCQEDTK